MAEQPATQASPNRAGSAGGGPRPAPTPSGPANRRCSPSRGRGRAASARPWRAAVKPASGARRVKPAPERSRTTRAASSGSPSSTAATGKPTVPVRGRPVPTASLLARRPSTSCSRFSARWPRRCSAPTARSGRSGDRLPASAADRGLRGRSLRLRRGAHRDGPPAAPATAVPVPGSGSMCAAPRTSRRRVRP